MTPGLSSRNFGTMPSGEPVEAWTLEGAGSVTMEVITLGATVTRLLVPDRHGAAADVVLGFSDLPSYLGGNAYFGAMVGRVAGRVSGAQFTLDGHRYMLPCNEPPNHLHGGWQGFDRKIWRARPVTREDGAPSLRLTYRSPDGEEGYPGNLDVALVFTLTAENTFAIESEVMSDRATPCSLTHHSYFNLAGEGASTIEDHQLQVHANEFVPVDETLALSGRLESVAGGVNDLREPQLLGPLLPKLHQQHGALYRLRQDLAAQPALAARVLHPPSGRLLHVFTTEPYLQVYSGRALDGTLLGKSGKPYRAFAGLCLECEGYADGANTPALGDIILRPGEVRRETTEYRFATLGTANGVAH